MPEDKFSLNWREARAIALEQNLQVIEHGWEQHVIIDEANEVIYRYPRHQAAADKLKDEVAILTEIHKQNWPVRLPVLIEHNDKFNSYVYIAGQVVSASLAETLTELEVKWLGNGLGRFLRQMHQLDTNIIDQKKTRQTTTLLEYYDERIRNGLKTNFHTQALEALEELQAHKKDMQRVVVHGDLHGLNMVIDPVTKELIGVIDISEMEAGDPHQDFRKIFMTEPRLLAPAIKGYGQNLNAETVKSWAYVNEWANLCHFADNPSNETYKRAWRHLRLWNQI